MRIDRFTTKNDEEVDLGDFTVLVGPNNTGKSQTLLDIHQIMKSNQGADSVQTTIVEEIEYLPQDPEDFFLDLSVIPHPQQVDRKKIRGIGSNLRGISNQGIRESQLESLRDRDDIREDRMFNNLTQFKVGLLDASSRLDIAESTATYDLDSGHPQNTLQKLYTSQSARNRLREAFLDTFGKDILLDYSSLRKFKLRISDDFGENENAMLEPPETYNQYKTIDDQGAGFNSFAGVVISLLLSRDRVVLLDEPEAFLHPAQARQFGSWMASHAAEIPGQLIISTHNSHFLSGILSSSEGIAIHRLNRAGNYTKYNTLPEETTSELASDPLLSNQRVIEGIFHKGVVVCEADGDALIYRIALDQAFDEQDFLFTHSHNKQTIDRITEVLTQASIPRAAVVDLDLLKDPGEFGSILRSLDSGANDFQDQMNTCNEFNQSIRSSDIDWSDIKEGGRDAIPKDAVDDFEQLMNISQDNGLFLVDVGELEGWIDLGGSKGPEWVVEALDEIDQGNISEELVAFVEEIRQYLVDQYEEIVVAGS